PRIVIDGQKMGFDIAHRRPVYANSRSMPRGAGTIEAASIRLVGNDTEQHLAKTLDRLRPGSAISRRDTSPLRRRQAALQLAAAFGQFEQALPAVLRAALLHDKALAHQLAELPVKALLGTPPDLAQ